jgi:cytochrome c
MKHVIRIFMACLAALGFMAGAMAQENGSKDEAKALAEAALAHIRSVGTEKAFQDFTTNKTNWTKKDMYVWATDNQGNCVSHGANAKLVGKNFIELKDPNGKPFVKEAIDLVKAKGSGWVDYEWAHPQSKKIESKTTYVQKIAGFDGWVAVGVYR